MTVLPSRPELIVNYSILNLRIKLASVQCMANAAWIEHRFEVDCRLRHPTGSFTYSVSNLCFDLKSFERFTKELRDLQQGRRSDAALTNVGEMLSLRVGGNSRNFTATLNIREFLAPAVATLNAKIEIDYDLFVNRLPGEVERFVDEIRLIEPAQSS
jgi:hypothetical protein